MQLAAQRIAQLGIDDDDPDERYTITKTKSNGKKSGSLRVAADVVQEAIDWPHLYITRVMDGARVGVPYKELRIQEFVYGFLEMLDNPKGKWDKEVMLNILKMLMQDAMDFPWGNARAFYELLGVDVENGV